MNCGQLEVMAAHGICFRCYRREKRAEDRTLEDIERELEVPPDRHNPGIRREHKKLFRGFTSVMVGLADLNVQRIDILTIRGMLEAYVAPIAEYLAATRVMSATEGRVNAKPGSESVFTVHTKPTPNQYRDDDRGADPEDPEEGENQ